jgi:hypothetical protein
VVVQSELERLLYSSKTRGGLKATAQVGEGRGVNIYVRFDTPRATVLAVLHYHNSSIRRFWILEWLLEWF